MPRQWADQPHSLIATIPFSKDFSHRTPTPRILSQLKWRFHIMGIIRGLNSIWLQAPNIPRAKLSIVRDFLTYCQCWSESMHHHHDAVGKEFFPSVEEISGVEGLMARNVEQHRAFTPGFEHFETYCLTCEPAEYDGENLQSLVEGFAGPLVQHLRDEIDTLRVLDKYDSDRIRQAYKRFEKSLMNTDNYRIAPLVFGTADRSFEGGIHDFPAVPFFVPYVIHYIFAMRYRGAWRFSPCTIWRDRRDLAFVD